MSQRHWFDVSHPRSAGWDAGAALLCVLVFWLPFDGRGAPWLHAALIVLLVAGMPARSRWPRAAFAVVAGATLAGAALGMTHDPFVAAAWMLYRVALTRGTTRSLNAVGVGAGVAIAAVAFLGTADAESTVRYTMLSLLALAAAWVLGGTTRRAALQAEHAMLAERQAAVTAERLRVAREVHDVVSHSLGTIAVTAGVAARDDDSVRMRDRLGRIETVSRHALDELRTTLVAVRESGERAERHPQPGIGDLAALVERLRASGVRVSLTTTGAEGLPAGIGLAAYRIVQEGLTNAARHAPGARCAVTVSGTPGELSVTVTDDGPGPARTPNDDGPDDGPGPARTPTDDGPGSGRASAVPGFGLVGLRERVEMLGGAFSAGPRSGGGFEVRAVVPVPEVARA